MALLNRGIVIPYTLVATQETICNASNISGMMPPPFVFVNNIGNNAYTA